MHEVVVAADREALAQLAAEFIARLAERSEKDRFHMALCGGKTPRLLYRKLASPPIVDEIPWQNLHIWWGDERAVGPESRESNYKMARETFLERAPISDDRVHRIEGELGAKRAAVEYERTLMSQFSGDVGFDLILLGVGVDGHTASIFPSGMDQLSEGRPVAVTHGGTPPLDRVTVTLDVINASSQVVFLVEGQEKAEIVERVLMSDETLPASRVSPAAGDDHLHFFLDRAAAYELDRLAER